MDSLSMLNWHQCQFNALLKTYKKLKLFSPSKRLLYFVGQVLLNRCMHHAQAYQLLLQQLSSEEVNVGFYGQKLGLMVTQLNHAQTEISFFKQEKKTELDGSHIF